jgi:hypothetical protein
MKYLKSIFTLLSLVLLFNCNVITQGSSSAPNPDFKIGQKGIEKKFKKEFDFQKMSVSIFMTTKIGVKELGLNLKFQKEDIQSTSDSLLKEYVAIIKKSVAKNLLNLEDYDYINITFENENIEGEFTKSTSVKIREQLK